MEGANNVGEVKSALRRFRQMAIKGAQERAPIELEDVAHGNGKRPASPPAWAHAGVSGVGHPVRSRHRPFSARTLVPLRWVLPLALESK